MNDNSQDTLSPFTARVYGLAVIAAGPLVMASTIAFIVDGEGINNGVLGGVIGVWSAFAVAIGLMGILRLAEPRAPRAAPVLTVIAIVAATAGVGFNVQAIAEATIGPDGALLDRAMDGGEAVIILAFLPWGLLMPLSLILVGITLWRTQVVPRWSAALLTAGGVLFVASRPERIETLALIADGVLVMALVPIGWAMITGARAAISHHENRTLPHSSPTG